jgi:hypothetical protein
VYTSIATFLLQPINWKHILWTGRCRMLERNRNVAGRPLKNNSNLKTYFRIMQFQFIFTLFQVNYRSPCIHLYIWEIERKNSEKNSHIHTLPPFEASLRLTRAIMDSTHSSFKDACQMIVKQIVTNDKHSSYSSDLSSCKTFNWVYTRKHLLYAHISSIVGGFYSWKFFECNFYTFIRANRSI